MSMSSIKYRPEIDGLRAIAVLSVVIFHLFPSYLPGGFAGVDIFFVISGYLITLIISRDINSTNFSFIDFYARRARRIFPALITVLISTLVAGWFLLLPDEYAQLGWHTLGGATFTSNLLLWSEVGYFDLSSIEKPLLHLWSLGVEEQFYLVWPLLLWAASRIGVSLIKVVVTIGTVSFALSLYQVFFAPDAAFYSPLSRCWQLSAGAALALLSQDRFHTTESVTGKAWFSLIGILLLIVTIFGLNEALIWPAPFAVIPVISAMILLSASGGSVVKWLLSSRVFVFFGSISFALYLWHWPLLSLHQIVENSVHTDARWAILVVSILLAYLTTRFVEKPVRFKGNLRKSAAVVTILLVVIGSIGALVNLKNGFDQRGDQVMATLSRDLTGGVTLPVSTTNWCGDIDLNFCSHQGRSPTVALLGDSHARSLYFGLRDFLAKRDESLIVLGNGRCPPYILDPSGGERSGCVDNMAYAVQKIRNDQNIHSVFVTYRTSQYFNSPDVTKTIFPTSDIGITNELLNVNALEQTLSQLKESGKKLIFLKDVPTMPFNVRSCLPRSGKGDDWDSSVCVSDRASLEDKTSSLNKALDKQFASMPDLSVIDLMDGICNEEICFGATENRLLYLDDNHLSIYGSHYVVGNLHEDFTEALEK